MSKSVKIVLWLVTSQQELSDDCCAYDRECLGSKLCGRGYVRVLARCRMQATLSEEATTHPSVDTVSFYEIYDVKTALVQLRRLVQGTWWHESYAFNTFCVLRSFASARGIALACKMVLFDHYWC